VAKAQCLSEYIVGAGLAGAAGMDWAGMSPGDLKTAVRQYYPFLASPKLICASST
jgi:hypothetical protein